MDNGYVRSAGKDSLFDMIAQEKLEGLINEFKNLKIPVVVEGKKDKLVLTRLGVANIFEISGKSLEYVTEEISRISDSVLILTDFDEEGRKKAHNLTKLFRGEGVNVNHSLRRKIKFLLNGITKIEDLNKISKLWSDVYHRKIYNKICSRNKILKRKQI